MDVKALGRPEIFHKREGVCFLVELAALVQTWPIQPHSRPALPPGLILVIALTQGFSVLELLTFGPG